MRLGRGEGKPKPSGEPDEKPDPPSVLPLLLSQLALTSPHRTLVQMSRLLKIPSLARPLSTLSPKRAVPPQLLPRLSSVVDTTSPEFKSRQDDMKVLEDDLKKRLERVYAGGGEKARERARGKGKLLVRERSVHSRTASLALKDTVANDLHLGEQDR